MKKQWKEYSEKYSQITTREQVLILLTGLVVISLITFHFFIDSKLISNKTVKRNISQLTSDNRNTAILINEYQLALKQDHNASVREKIAKFEKKLAQIDIKLLTMASELINPIQMRFALLELLKIEKGVELLSFELTGAEPLLSQMKPSSGIPNKNSVLLEGVSQNDNNSNSEVLSDSASLNLYKHGIKIKLSGEYFALQRYLQQLEELSWKFFWQEFNFQVTEYPKNELSIEIYSLGSKKEFVGV